ncbi:hypothetical protein D3C87_2177470 [compost metagenome]
MNEHDEEHASELEAELDKLVQHKKGELVEDNPKPIEEIRKDIKMTTDRIYEIMAEITAYEFNDY